MKNEIQGVVDEYFTKPVSSGSFLHSITVNGSKYSVFSQDDKRRANEGDTVAFTAEQNDKGYWNITGNFKVVKRATGHQSGKKQAYAPKEDERQNSILRQNAMSQANTLVSALIGADAYEGLGENDLAKEIIRLADDFFFPYAKSGKKPE